MRSETQRLRNYLCRSDLPRLPAGTSGLELNSIKIQSTCHVQVNRWSGKLRRPPRFYWVLLCNVTPVGHVELTSYAHAGVRRGATAKTIKTPEESLSIKCVAFTYQLMVYADMLLYWAQKNYIRNNIEAILINSKRDWLRIESYKSMYTFKFR